MAVIALGPERQRLTGHLFSSRSKSPSATLEAFPRRYRFDGLRASPSLERVRDVSVIVCGDLSAEVRATIGVPAVRRRIVSPRRSDLLGGGGSASSVPCSSRRVLAWGRSRAYEHRHTHSGGVRDWRV